MKSFEEIWKDCTKQGVIQKKAELEMLYDELIKLPKLENCFETGTHMGGTSVFFANLFDHVTSIDLGTWVEHEPLKNKFPNLELLLGDINDQAILDFIKSKNIKYDVIMIDDDHTYEGVKKAFENLMQFARPGTIIIFHDILETAYHINANCHVDQLWKEIKDKYKSKELIYTGENLKEHPYDCWMNHEEPNQWGGIGIIEL